jgi:hypothetical protein
MVTRLLPPDEWDKVAVAGVPRALDPHRNLVIVTEDAGHVVGCVVLMTALHAEFLWIADAHRGRAVVFRALWRRLVQEARTVGAPTVLAAALSRTMRNILNGLGHVLPGRHYVMSIEEISRCRPQ